MKRPSPALIRHPKGLPLCYHLYEGNAEPASPKEDMLLSFVSKEQVGPGSYIRISLAAIREREDLLAQVFSCNATETGYEVTVGFLDEGQAYRARMAEQICHIEAYRAQVREREGRLLTAESAAREWILRFAASFPDTQESRPAADRTNDLDRQPPNQSAAR